ncbi:hypothetical protein E4L95_16180 [Paracoccus liaowanqingii]|uniref:Uncharacterized protein n=1 Tax=Paracoccus liaowanqingii TaxID=2560053 RepID=A0A4Z1CAD2_9RHOB|nr:hypothetical protein [Paracoccus liaowanqingii]TGN52612.1 hypothetical protein E4L95_16180 [Paracoccus liaowanqingii]
MGKKLTSDWRSEPFSRGTPITRIQFLTAQIRACQIRLDDAVAQSMAAQVALNEAQECLAVAGQALERVVLEAVIQPPKLEPAPTEQPCVIVLEAADIKNTPGEVISPGAFLVNTQLIMFDQNGSGP